VSKVKSKLDGIDSLVRGTGQHPWAHLEAGYWRVQVDDQPVLGYVMRVRAEIGDTFTFEVYADARNARGQRIWVRREESLNSAVASPAAEGSRIDSSWSLPGPWGFRSGLDMSSKLITRVRFPSSPLLPLVRLLLSRRPRPLHRRVAHRRPSPPPQVRGAEAAPVRGRTAPRRPACR
jgi:hypothetical protein